MAAAVAPFRPTFITPMAAVAGAVAEEVLTALTGPGITPRLREQRRRHRAPPPLGSDV